jgi:hypothetical protein
MRGASDRAQDWGSQYVPGQLRGRSVENFVIESSFTATFPAVTFVLVFISLVFAVCKSKP